jgi:hypothetical protein
MTTGIDMARIDQISMRQPAILITPPYKTASGKWEVTEPGRPTASYEPDQGNRMLDDLDRRYPS